MADSYYETRTTSAGYRFPTYNRPRSTFEDRRPVGPSTDGRGRATATPSGAGSRTAADDGTRNAYETINPIIRDRIWTQTLENEKRRNKTW